MTWSPGCEPRACSLPGVPLAAPAVTSTASSAPAEGPSAPALLSGVQGRWLLWRLAAEGWLDPVPAPPPNSSQSWGSQWEPRQFGA